ncbi:hypothetical protein BC830DRAFT_1152952 [Chytriomyces sp. MP71]|nr:hypothetical protein BC830DRAFT_1152952 [Chytriomyces sp. MP71]
MAKSRRTRRKSVTPAAETRHKEEGAFSTAATAIAEEGGAASLLATFSTLKQQFAQVEASNRLLRTKWNLDEPPSAPCVSEDGLLDAMQWTVADPSPKRVVSRNFDSSSFFKRHAPQEPKLHFPYAINRAAMDALAPAHHAHVAFTGLALVNTDNDEEEATNLTPPSTSYLPTTSSFNGSSRVHTPRFSSSVTGVHIARSSATCTPKSLPVSPLDSLSFNSADLTLMVKGSPLNVEGALIQCPVEGCTRIVDSKRMLSHHKHQRHCKSLSVTYLNGFTTGMLRAGVPP